MVSSAFIPASHPFSAAHQETRISASLASAAYNPCYCNNIAPSETERTCRKVGAHRKEAQGKANRTPAQVEYDRAYNRLKQRKNRKKISVEEWNASVAEAMKVLEQSEQGKINDEEMRKRFEAF